MSETAREILEMVKNGEMNVEEALTRFKMEPYEDLGYAKIDHHRRIRQGVAEVIYGASKTTEQIRGIVKAMMDKGQNVILITRIDEKKAEGLSDIEGFHYEATCHMGIIGERPEPVNTGFVVVATGGTSDVPVAEEAAITCEYLGNKVVRLYDVGVAGLHRLLSHQKEIMEANVIVAIAGMEGALASVIAGLADCPVIAVPTSVGYGASFNGLAALLSMLNSCGSGVSVVNIDNGFGAGYQASMINHLGEKK